MPRQTCGEILRRYAPQNDTPQNHSDVVLEQYRPGLVSDYEHVGSFYLYSGLHLNEERKKVGWDERSVSGRDATTEKTVCLLAQMKTVVDTRH